MVFGISTERAHGPQRDLLVKVILLGDYKVGKSSLVRQLARQKNTPENENSATAKKDFAGSEDNSTGRPHATVVRSQSRLGGFVNVKFTHQDKSVIVQIADTGGQERYRSMTSSYYRGAQGCLLMFDVTQEESFNNLDQWIEDMEHYRSNEPLSCILVGNRCNSSNRTVSYERASKFAENRGFPYMELDMDHMTNVHHMFEKLLDSVTFKHSSHESSVIFIKPYVGRDFHQDHKQVHCACS